MKTLIVGSTYGELDKINLLYEKHPEVDMCIAMGDNYLFSESTPVEFFLRKKFRDRYKPISKKINFEKPVFALYGELDDPFIPQNEMKFGNFFSMWQSTINFAAMNEDKTKSRDIKIGFLSGYYNQRGYKNINKGRMKLARERKSLALCRDDFNKFSSQVIDYLFTHDAPIGHLHENMGCPAINGLMNRVSKLTFCGHYNDGIELLGLVIVGPLSEGYWILDMYDNNLKRFEAI